MSMLFKISGKTMYGRKADEWLIEILPDGTFRDGVRARLEARSLADKATAKDLKAVHQALEENFHSRPR